MRIRFWVMMRQWVITLLFAWLIMLPLSAYALGLGSIRIKSGLNEPLDAEIELLSATTADLKGLKIKLASREAFMRAGIDRPGHLSQLQFTIKRRSNGRAYLQVTTKQSVREPFLDFLLEMDWKNGRMLREYTVLLDPPDRLQQQPTVAESPQTESPAVVAKQEQQDTSSPFIEPEKPVEEPKPVVKEEPVRLDPSIEDDLVVAESIAAADVGAESVPETEPAPLAESISEQDLQSAVEPEVSEKDSITGADEQPGAIDEPSLAASEAVESADRAYADPFAGEKFPRIPIKTDKRLRQAEEAELTAIAAEEPPLEQSPLTEEATLQERLKDEELALAEETIAAEEMAEQIDKPVSEPVASVTTKRRDKLWNIAESMMPADDAVSIYQVMMALLQSNPDAFVDGNVHRLKVGKVLRIEDPSLLSAMSKRQAAREYIAQTRKWEDYRQRLAASRTPRQAEMAGDVESPAAEVLPEQAPAEESTGELVLAAPEGDKQTAVSTGDQQATVNNEVVILREQIRQALREAEAEGNKNSILNEKLRDLESQLQELQRSVTVKDDELATLQQQLSDLNKRNIEAERAAMTSPHSEIPSVATTPEAAKPDSGVLNEADVTARSPTPEQAAAKPAEPETKPAEQTPATAEPAPVTDKGPGMTDKAFGVLDSIKRTLSGAISSIPISPMILAIGGGVIVVLLLLMLLLMQRRRQAANFQESILSGIPSHEIMASEEASLETNLSGESSFLSDFAISGASALQGDDGDVDPLTEADVFMAYGRYEAAEERILEAIKNDPERQELRVKLLELYNTTKNKAAFEAAAEDMFTHLGNDTANPLWQKVIVMGSILAPENPLFSDTPSGEDVTRIRNTPDTSSELEDVLDLDFDENVASAEETTAAPAVDELGLDLDFAMGNETDETGVVPDNDGGVESAGAEPDFSTDETAEIESLDLDLDLDLSLEDTAQTEVAMDLEAGLPADETSQLNLDESLDLDMSEIEKDAATAMDLQTGDKEDSVGLTLDREESTPQEEQAGDGLTMEMSQPAFDGLEMPSVEVEVDATDVAELDTPSLLMDEVGTKLDLAKAYIDMGDPDGAKSILDEVLEEGSVPQRQEAQQLMQQI